VLVFCWEVGAAGALIPVIRHALGEGWQMLDASLEPGASILRQSVPGLERCPEGANLQELAEVMLAGVGHPKHVAGWSRWKALNRVMPSLVVLDHWKGLGRFQNIDGSLNSEDLPQKICVIDDLVEAALQRMGVPAEKIEIVGNLAASEKRKGPAVDDSLGLRKRLGLSEEAALFFLASETLHRHGFHEPCDDNCQPLEQLRLASGETILEWVADQAAVNGACLALRPHPNQPVLEVSRNVLVVPWSVATDDQMLALAQKVWGLSSMINAKAAAAGKETENLASLLEGWSPRHSFMDDDIWDGLVQRGVYGGLGNGQGSHMPGADVGHVLQLLEILGA
jgi:hypothetical protein